jgi:hypothetical protein
MLPKIVLQLGALSFLIQGGLAKWSLSMFEFSTICERSVTQILDGTSSESCFTVPSRNQAPFQSFDIESFQFMSSVAEQLVIFFEENCAQTWTHSMQLGSEPGCFEQQGLPALSAMMV